MKNSLIEPLEARIAPASFSIAAPAVMNEGNDPLTPHNLEFKVTLTGPITSDVMVNYKTVDGLPTPVNTAAKVSDNDYTATTGTLTFHPGGDATQTIPVPIIGDTKFEQGEKFSVVLETPVGATIQTASATGTILNDDVVPTVTITDASLVEGNSGQSSMVFTLTLSNPSGTSVSVRPVTVNDTATAGLDYVAVIDDPEVLPVVFPAGTTTKTFSVNIIGDTTFESAESFLVNLIKPVGLTIGTPQARGTITNDDVANTDPVLNIDDVQILEGASGTKQAEFTVTLSGAITGNVTVKVGTQDTGSATAGADFTAPALTTLTFRPGEATTQKFSVPILGDANDELSETFLVNLSEVSANAAIGSGTGKGTILNDDLRILVDNVSRSETNGETTLDFVVRLSAASTHPVSVSYSTSDGTAKVGDGDYDAIPLTQVTFAPGETQKTLSVKVHGDTIGELNENLFLNLSGEMNALLGRVKAVGTIRDDDASLQVGDVQVVEGASGTKQAIFTVTLANGPLTGDVTVIAGTADDTATAGSDYDAVAPTTLTFHPGEKSKQVAVTIRGDLDVESDETFFLNLSDAVNATNLRGKATGTIVGDDASLRVSDVQILEGGTNGTTTAVFTVTLVNGPASGDVTVKVGTADIGSASAGVDYTAVMPTTLTFLHGGNTSIPVRVSILGDAIVEANETFLLKLTDAAASDPAASVVIGRGTAAGTILNDDGNVFTIGDVTVTEGDSGSLNAVFVVKLLAPATQEVMVDVATENGTALAGSDFTESTATLDFAVGATQQIFSVPVLGNLIKEVTETFTVRLSNPAGGSAIARDAAIGTILDNDVLDPTVSIGNAVLAEGNAGTSSLEFTATLDRPSDSPVTVAFATHDDTNTGAHRATADGDYTASSGTITFAPGETSKKIAIPIVGDTTDEFDETFGITLSSATGGTLGTKEAVGTILNDDLSVSVTGSSVAEGNSGTKTLTFQVTLSGAPAGHPVSVNYTTVDGTAISTGAPRDFVSKTGVLTFPAGSTVTQNVSIVVNGDTRIENDEQFLLKLLSAQNAIIATAEGTGTILNDDGTPVVSVKSVPITEGNSGTSDLTFTLTLDKPSDVPVTVKVSTTDGVQPGGAVKDQDYTAITDRVVTFAPGQTTTDPVVVKIVGDLADEPQETFSLEVRDAVASQSGEFKLLTTATGTIIDNDLRTLSIAGVTITEGNSGTKAATFTVSLSSAATQEVRVDFATADDTATDGPDYVGTRDTLTIPAGDLSGKITVQIVGDVTVEGAERFFLNLSNPVNALLPATARQAVGNIVDDESLLKLVVDSDTTLAEDGGTHADLHVVRSGDISKAVTVQYETVDITTKSTGPLADYVTTKGTISFPANSAVASGTISVPITADSNYENNDTFKVRLFNPTGAAIDNANGLTDEAIFTITDNDVRPTLSIVDPTPVKEGSESASTPLEFSVRLSAANEREVVTVFAESADIAGLATAANSAGATGKALDFTLTGKQMLTFNQGDTEKMLPVTILGDFRYEADETFHVNLSAPSKAVIEAGKGTATGTILNDDVAPLVSFQAASFTATEGNTGLTTTTVTLRLSAVSELPISLKVTTHDGTAVSTGDRPDFVALTDFLVNTYVPGDQTGTFSFPVSIIGDTTDEADETFTLTLSDPVNARVETAPGTVTIMDNDDAPTLLVTSASQAEGDSGKTDMIFTVSLSEVSGKDVSVDVKTVDGSAVSTGAMRDFVATSGTVTIPAGQTTGTVKYSTGDSSGNTTDTFHVPIIGDTFRELDETFTVVLSNSPNASGADAAVGTGTILADSDSTVGVEIKPAFLVEGNSGTQKLRFTVNLSAPLLADTTFTAVTTNGTATSGSDYVALNQQVTITKGTTTGAVEVTVNGDTTFEATESVLLDVRNVQSGDTPFAVVGGLGKGTIFNDDVRQVDARTIQFIDVDGDLATIHVSKGTLSTNVLSFSAANATVGGRQLQAINFTGATQFQNANLSVTADTQPGFDGDATGAKGDGHVNVGAIFAANVDTSILDFTNGIDLGIVNIDGDLGKVIAGDDFVTAAIANLKVLSMGSLGTATQGTATGGNTFDLTSFVLGPIRNLNVTGDFGGLLDIVGDEFGTITNLHIGGALRGGSDANSGRIIFTGGIESASIGKIVGGTGDFSGLLGGAGNGTSHITSLRVLGDVTGGTGSTSGVVSASIIRALSILGNLTGGVGADSGKVIAPVLQTLVVKQNVTGGVGARSGEIFATVSAGTVRVVGELRGGTGERSGLIGVPVGVSGISALGGIFGGIGASSGRIEVAGAITALKVGAITGGSGANSGSIRVGTSVQELNVQKGIHGGGGAGSGGVDVGAGLGNGFIGGDIVGGDSAAGTSLLKSGFLIAHRILNLKVDGDLKSGVNNGTGLALSGTIRSETTIGALNITGSVIGSAQTAAIISAPGDSTGGAIQSLAIGRSAIFAEILAGYGVDGTLAKPRGSATNSDARIGKVQVLGKVRASVAGVFQSSSIIAGVDAGTDGLFGTVDDLPIGGPSTTNAAGALSRIASIIVGGSVSAGTVSAGIEAQYLNSIRVAGRPFFLKPGVGNDLATELTTGSKIFVFEVPVV